MKQKGLLTGEDHDRIQALCEYAKANLVIVEAATGAIIELRVRVASLEAALSEATSGE